ncbi:MAG: hypothetical protein WC028_30200 [Candidatus Obscuribacterales bacterium]
MTNFLLKKLEMSGFRAYLKPKTFEFADRKSLAVFAPNGHGKSSLVDAFEFMFSENGTLERLGLRAINNSAGPSALAHYKASEKSIQPEVKLWLKAGSSTEEIIRKATGTSRTRPLALEPLIECFTVSPIIRGHELRAFVERQTSEDRYKDVVRWFDLEPLLRVQRNLKELRKRLKADVENEQPIKEIDRAVSNLTANTLTSWNDDLVLDYARKLASAADTTLVLDRLDGADPAYLELARRCKDEEERLGIEGLQQIRRTALSLYEEQDFQTGGKCIGHIAALETAVSQLKEAVEHENEEKSSAAKSVFARLWQAAEPLFCDQNIDIQNCPVCATPIATSEAGSAEIIHQHLKSNLSELEKYAKSVEQSKLAETNVASTKSSTKATLGALLGILDSHHSNAKSILEISLKKLENSGEWDVQDAETAKSTIRDLIKSVDCKLAELSQNLSQASYCNVHAAISALIAIKNERHYLLLKQSALSDLSDQVTIQSNFLIGKIREIVQKILDKLTVPINSIYKEIQGANAVAIKLELPSDEELVMHKLHLLVDFAGNGSRVQPSGYLSDSQIHSLALAIRLAGIKLFNDKAPILILDDIVTSYDADHRRNICSLLAKEFTEFQVIVTTHDERFFLYLKDQLGDQPWHFTRIIRLEDDNGPIFGDHRITETMIASAWSEGRSAANEIRQAEEEWLLQISREFGVDVRIRALERSYSYERAELADALAEFLKKLNMVPPVVSGVSNRFLISLQQGVIENFGSHFQDTPYGTSSIGDEKVRWREFTEFREKFACPRCGKKRFQRPNSLRKPVCSATACETQFAFS